MISIIIPIYNAEKEIKRMLRSIQNQSFTEYEVIMIDDGSKDRSAEICKNFTKNDIRFKYYSQKNQGVSIARNNGLKRANGEYIAFLDADDDIDENYFEELLKACQNADIAVCDVVVERDGREHKRFTGGDVLLNKEEAINLLLSRRVINSGPCAKLYKRNVLSTQEFPLMKTYEDILFNLGVFSNAAFVAITSKTQYHYIENIQGAMSSMGKAPSLDIIVASEQIMNYIEKKNDEVNPECLYVTISHLFQYVLAMIRKECVWDNNFILEARKLYRKYWSAIWKCKDISLKEKIVFGGFIYGWIYSEKKWIYVNN